MSADELQAEQLESVLREQREVIVAITRQVHTVARHEAYLARRARRRRLAIACWSSSTVSLLFVVVVCLVLR